jgi:hypothetical protein
MAWHPSAYRRTGSVVARRLAVFVPLLETSEYYVSSPPATPEAVIPGVQGDP